MSDTRAVGIKSIRGILSREKGDEEPLTDSAEEAPESENALVERTGTGMQPGCYLMGDW